MNKRSMTSAREEWLRIAVRRGHVLRMDSDTDEIDIFVVDYDFHNGPGCMTCDWSACMSCTPVDRIPICRAVMGGR